MGYFDGMSEPFDGTDTGDETEYCPTCQFPDQACVCDDMYESYKDSLID